MTGNERLELKANLLTEGIAATPEALEGVGTEFKEQNHGLFGWDFVDHKDLELPDDFVLSDGTVVQFRYNPSSPYVMEMRDGGRVVVQGRRGARHRRADPAAGLLRRDRPRAAPSMRKIAQVGGEDCFFVCYQNHCAHFAHGEQCSFCNLVATKKTYDSVLIEEGDRRHRRGRRRRLLRRGCASTSCSPAAASATRRKSSLVSQHRRGRPRGAGRGHGAGHHPAVGHHSTTTT